MQVGDLITTRWDSGRIYDGVVDRVYPNGKVVATLFPDIQPKNRKPLKSFRLAFHPLEDDSYKTSAGTLADIEPRTRPHRLDEEVLGGLSA
jgi:hypothetical protein